MKVLAAQAADADALTLSAQHNKGELHDMRSCQAFPASLASLSQAAARPTCLHCETLKAQPPFTCYPELGS